jgi:hypothetical protein
MKTTFKFNGRQFKKPRKLFFASGFGSCLEKTVVGGFSSGCFNSDDFNAAGASRSGSLASTARIHLMFGAIWAKRVG